MNIKQPRLKGWQLLSARAPSVLARTWAKMRGETVLLAKRVRLVQFQAGMVEVKIHGSGPSSGSNEGGV